MIVSMSEWNYTKCAKPFETEAAAIEFMETKDFAGYVLKREHGYAAVCPTYPDGYYPDAVVVAERDNSKNELSKARRSLPISSCC
jgi:hypothetical protein